MRRYPMLVRDLAYAGQKLGAEDLFRFLRIAEEKGFCELCLARFLDGGRRFEMKDLCTLLSEVRSCDAENLENIYGIDALKRALLAELFYEKTALCMYPTHLQVLLFLWGYLPEETRDLMKRYEKFLEDVLQDAAKKKISEWNLIPIIYEFWEKEVLVLWGERC